jgi:hypothetical protein
MKAITYSALVMILFFRNIDKGKVTSIKTIIKLTDKVCIKMTGNPPDLSVRTKYRTVESLIEEGILSSEKKDGTHKISLSNKAKDYITENLTIMV